MNTVTWNQSFTFNNISLDPYEFENAELSLEVWDATGLSLARGDTEAGIIGKIFGEKLVGHYSIGLSTLFRSPNHQLHKQWLRLQAKNDPTICTGFLLVSCFVIGQHQIPPSNKEGDDEENQTVSRQALLEQQRHNQGLQVVSAPVFEKRTFQLILKIFKGDGLPYNQGTNEKYWVKVRTQGCDEETNRVDRIDTSSLHWNTMFKFPVYMPTYNDKIVIKLMRSQPYGFFILSNSEYFLANIPEKPSRLDIFNISELLARDGKMDPQWINMYGVRAEDLKGDGSDQPASAWLGRILLSLHLIDYQGSKPQLKKDSTPLPPEPKSSLYTMQADVFELYCPEFLKSIGFTQQDKMKVTLNYGTIKMKSKKGKYNSQNEKAQGIIEWKRKSSLDTQDIELPDNNQQRAHLFVYLNHGPKRVGFIRIDTQEIIETKNNQKPRWRNVMSMEKRNIVIGQLLIHIMITPKKERNQQYKRVAILQSKPANYPFICQIVSGYEIAPHIDNIQTFVKVEIGNVNKCLKTKLAPGHFPLYDFTEFLSMVPLYKDLESAPSMTIYLIDQNEKELGKALVLVSSIFKPRKENRAHQHPQLQYFNLFDNSGNVVGKILARFQLVDNSKQMHNEGEVMKVEFEQELRANLFQTNVQVCLVGVRGLAEKVKKPKIEVLLTESILDIENFGTANNEYRQLLRDVSKISDPWELALQMRPHVLDKLNGEQENDPKTKFEKIWKEMKEFIKDQNDVIRNLELNFYLDITLQNENKQDSSFKRHMFELSSGCKGNLIKEGQDQNHKDKNKLEAVLTLSRERFVYLFQSNREGDGVQNNEINGTSMQSIEQMLQLLFNIKSKVRIEYQQIGKDQKQENKEFKDRYGRFSSFECIKTDENQDYLKDTTSPNFGVIITFRNVNLNKQLLCWPLLNIKLKDEADNLLMQVTQPLFLYTTQKVDQDRHSWSPKMSDIKVALAQFIYSPDQQLAQQQENLRRTYLRRILDQKTFKQKYAREVDLQLNIMKHEITRKEIDDIPSDGNEGLENLFDDDEQRDTQANVDEETKESSNQNAYQEEIEEQEEHRYLTIEDLKQRIQWGDSKANRDDEKERLKEQANSNDIVQTENEDNIITITWQKKNEDQLIEQAKRMEKIKENNEISEKLGRIKRYFDRNKSNSKLAEEIINALKKVRQWSENLEREPRDQEELQRLFIERNDTKELKVKRDLDLEEEVQEILPFSKLNFMSVPIAPSYQLFVVVQTLENKPIQGQIYRSGKKLNAFLRFKVKITEDDTKDQTLQIRDFSLDSADQESVLKQLISISNVDIFNLEFLEHILTSQKDLRLILTVLRCQNLTAVDNYSLGWLNQIKQEVSKSSADPYVSVEVGENQNIKSSIDDHKKNTLHPEFNKDFNFTVNIPDDWNLVVKVFDRDTNRLKLYSTDVLIGATAIDLEERRFGNRLQLCKLINEIQLNQQEKARQKHDKFSNHQFSHKAAYSKFNDNFKSDRKNNYNNNIRVLTEEKNWLQACPIKQPIIEIRSLKNEHDQAQGTIQLMTELLKEDELDKRKINDQIKTTESEEYQIRLIIYKVVGVFEADGSNVGSMWVRAVMEANNWREQPEQKNTESQSNITAGKAIFNYRMIFGLKMPAEFPRIKLQIYSGRLINENQALGETTIDLKKTIQLLKKQGLEDKKVFVKFVGQNNRKVGHALIQLQILTKSDAAVNPVGEGWGEPNRDPYLARPSQGSFAQRFGLPSLPNISLGLPSFQKYLIIIGVAVILVIIAGFLLMYFKK